MEETVAQFIARTLAQEGLTRFFLLTGGDQALWIALDQHGIDPVLARSEASAVYMADAHAQATGQVAVTYGQAGPGAANVAAALADPYWSRTPVLSITGGTVAGSRYRNEYQELDTAPMLEAVTYANFELPSPDRIVDLLPRAIAVARQFGPVNLTVPKDMFGVQLTSTPNIVHVPQAAAGPQPDTAAVADAVTMIGVMRAPAILAGTGAKRAGAGPELLELAARLGAPIVTSPGGKGVVSESEPVAAGVIGRYSGTAANAIAGDADGFVVVGSRAGGLVTDGYRFGGGDTPVVHLDHDASSLTVHPGPGVRVHTDLVDGLRAILARLDTTTAAETWIDQVSERRQSWVREVESLPAYGASGQLEPHALFDRLNRRADELTVVADTGYMTAWTSALYRPSRPGGYLRANGSLGWALPAALGAQLGDPAHRVVCVTGDGGLGYHVGDLETARRRHLPVIVVVLNNRSLAFEYHEQKYRWDGQVVPVVNDLSDLDHAEVARAFGWRGLRVTTLEEYEKALDVALDDSTQPSLLDVVVDKEAFAPITNFDRVLERRI